MESILEAKYRNLKNLVGDMESVLVAFSGGVDSTLLTSVANDVLGDGCFAATVDSPLNPSSTLEDALITASRLEVEHIVVDLNELENDKFRDNPPERCYICKRERFGKLVDLADREGLSEVLDGTNAGDAVDFRPGIRAAEELSVRSPLKEAGFQKHEIRALSRELGLPNWDLPSSPCLATRIPYFQRITPQKLSVVDRAERYLVSLGLSQVRLRYVDDMTARIEVSRASIPLLATESVREKVLDKLKQFGFVYVTVDLAGYRMGSMNEALPDTQDGSGR